MRTRSILASSLATATIAATAMATPAFADMSVQYKSDTGACTIRYSDDDAQKQAFEKVSDAMAIKYEPSLKYLTKLLRNAIPTYQNLAVDQTFSLAKYVTNSPFLTEADKKFYTDNQDEIENKITKNIGKKHLVELSNAVLRYYLWDFFRTNKEGYTMTWSTAQFIKADFPAFLTGYNKSAWNDLYWVKKNPKDFTSYKEAWNLSADLQEDEAKEYNQHSLEQYKKALIALHELGNEQFNKGLPLPCNDFLGWKLGSSTAGSSTTGGTMSPGAIAAIIGVIAALGALGAWATGMIPGVPALLR